MRAYLDAEIGFVADTLWRDDAALHQFLLQDYQQLPEPLAVDAAREAFDERFASRSDYLVAAVSRVGHAVARGEVNQLNPWRAHQSDSYVKLVVEFPLRPLRNDTEFKAAAAVMERLAVRGEDNLDAGERDYLDGLDEFISSYDRKVLVDRPIKRHAPRQAPIAYAGYRHQPPGS